MDFRAHPARRAAGGAARAEWLTEEARAEPRNIYGVTKFAAESLCRLVLTALFGLAHRGLGRSSRVSSPRRMTAAHAIAQSDENTV